MKISIIGTGYVGLGVGVCLADLGNKVTCLDIDENKIKKLKLAQPTIHEERLPQLLKKNLSRDGLFFTTNYNEAVKDAEVIFLAVGTPQKKDGQAELKYLKQALIAIAKRLEKYTVIVNKSTVPVGTGKMSRELIAKYYKGKFSIVSNPEFQREGTAIDDFLRPDRIVLGFEEENSPAVVIMKKLYAKIKAPSLLTNLESAEMIKYAANAFLATKISFINEIANICDSNEADIKMVARGMGMDTRIGEKFLVAGLGYGGSCFPKDVSALYKIAGANGYWFQLLEAVININKKQSQRVIMKVKQLLGRDLKDNQIAIFGLAFKAGTDDVRESPAIDVIKQLLKLGAKVIAFDPEAQFNAKKILGDRITYARTMNDALRNSEALIIATEWPQFARVSPQRVKYLMKLPNIIDGRNLLDPARFKQAGFNYLGIGR